MPAFSSCRSARAALLLASIASLGDATTYLSPAQDIVLPASGSASNPLEWLGANGPFFAGPNINGVDNTVPDNCYVEQVAYVVRHGSRFPDSGAYSGWVTLYEKIQAAQYTATGELSFLPSWQPVLTNPTLEMSQENPTGFKEAFDLGYQLRTRYPNLYAYGTPFISWANLYPRVVQTAQNFVRGFLGSTAASLGTVITVNSTGSPEALFDSLSPSDLCPNFLDGNGGTEATDWDATYLPPITARLNALLTGNLNFTTSDVSLFPYLCGFESHITGTLSPWCGTFSDEELTQYEYRQDLRYFYGIGPGVDLSSKMMLPFLNSLVGLLDQGPGINGTFANGTSFTLPDILTAFLNDGQITELGAATGVWDDVSAPNGTAIPSNWTYRASHFVSMRGTVAFERLNCAASSNSTTTTTLTTQTSTSTCSVSTATTTALDCHQDNCYRQFVQSTALVSSFCSGYTTATSTATTGLPTFVSQCSSVPTAISSACSCVVPAPTAPSSCGASSTSSSSSISSTVTSSSATATPTLAIKQTVGNYSFQGCWTEATNERALSGASYYDYSAMTLEECASDCAGWTYFGVEYGGECYCGSSPNTGSVNTTLSDCSFTCPGNQYEYCGAGNRLELYKLGSAASTGNGVVKRASVSSSTSTASSATATPTSASGNQTYIRILLNDAVYPVPACQDGPGKSCLLSEYVTFIGEKIEAAGNLHDRCNVTNPQSPTSVKGASFFTDLSDSWLATVTP